MDVMHNVQIISLFRIIKKCTNRNVFCWICSVSRFWISEVTTFNVHSIVIPWLTLYIIMMPFTQTYVDQLLTRRWPGCWRICMCRSHQITNQLLSCYVAWIKHWHSNNCRQPVEVGGETPRPVLLTGAKNSHLGCACMIRFELPMGFQYFVVINKSHPLKNIYICYKCAIVCKYCLTLIETFFVHKKNHVWATTSYEDSVKEVCRSIIDWTKSCKATTSYEDTVKEVCRSIIHWTNPVRPLPAMRIQWRRYVDHLFTEQNQSIFNYVIRLTKGQSQLSDTRQLNHIIN